MFPGNHINYHDKHGDEAKLDVDDRDGYGPETVTIHDKHQDWGYVYGVFDYQNRRSHRSTMLSNSQARVQVYIGKSLVKTYYGKPGTEGTAWIPFMIDELGIIQDLGVYDSPASYTSSDISNTLGRYLTTRTAAPNRPSRTEPALSRGSAPSPRGETQAGEWNTKGEKAYHQKGYSKAIEYYRKAIDLDSNYGQAYSNLGLAYQKNAQIPEAIWANRKAIALAHGKNKDTVQASSFYNIARIYESQERWQRALQNYELALERRQHSAYTQGIERMRAKLHRQPRQSGG